MKLNFQKLDIEIPVEIPVNFMILTGTGIPANRLILTGTGILPGSRSILACHPIKKLVNKVVSWSPDLIYSFTFGRIVLDPGSQFYFLSNIPKCPFK